MWGRDRTFITAQDIIDHPRSAVHSVVSVCLSVCPTITFESLVGSSYLHIRFISREYGSSSHMKVIGTLQSVGVIESAVWTSLAETLNC